MMSPTHRIYDLLIILAVLAGMAFAALRAIQGKRGSDVSEYFLARRDIGWLSVALSLFAASLWVFWSLMQATQVAQAFTGWFLPGGVVIGALIVLGLGFASPYTTSAAMTMPSLLGERFGRQVSFAVALASIGLTLFVHIPFTILIATQIVNALMGWDPMSSGLLMVVIPGLFVVAGGYPSSISMQSVAGVAAGIGLLFLAVNGVLPGGEGVLHQAQSDTAASWPPLIAGMSILGLWSLCMEQHAVQRVFAARSRVQGRTGSLAAAGLVVLAVVALGAGMGSFNVASLSTSSAGVAGPFIVAAVMALAMASLTGHFMSIATLIAIDVFRPAQKSAGEAALVLVGRLTNTAVVILAILVVSSISLLGPAVLEWMMPIVVVVAPPIVAVVIFGLAWPRMHGRGALAGLVTGWIGGLVQAGLNSNAESGVMESAVLAFALSAVVFVFVSLTVSPLGTLGKVPGTILQVRKP